MAQTTTTGTNGTATYLAEGTLNVVSTAAFGPIGGSGPIVVVQGGGFVLTVAISNILTLTRFKVVTLLASSDTPNPGSYSFPPGSTVTTFAWQNIPVGNIPGKSSRIFRTDFDRTPIRGEFTFDTLNTSYPFSGAIIPGCTYVKVARSTYAVPWPRRAWLGDPVTGTGRTKFYTGNPIAIDSVKRRVIVPFPAQVHQEQDIINW